MHITQPTLLVSKQKCLANIAQMLNRAAQFGAELVPHFKTHQSLKVGQWLRKAGIEAITVSSLDMAAFFAADGWQDITLAMPFNPREAERLGNWPFPTDLKLFLNNEHAVVSVGTHSQRKRIGFYIEIDTGYHRSGLAPTDHTRITAILACAAAYPHLQFMGFYSHAGHSYQAHSKQEVAQIHVQNIGLLKSLKKRYQTRFPNLWLVTGDTPCCSIAEPLSGLERICPGNFVYYDLKQHSIGSNRTDQIALCLAAPILELYPTRSEALLHAGWSHLGQDRLSHPEWGSYSGQVVSLQGQHWSKPIEGAYVKKLSQEHGLAKLPHALLQQLNTGDLLGILPVHACATALLMRNNTQLIDL